MIVKFEEILVLLTVFQLFLFALVLLMKKSTRQSNQFFLAVFFFSLACNILNFFIYNHAKFFISTKIIHLFYLGSAFAFVYAPAFYLYLLNYTSHRHKSNKGNLLHFIPFALYMGYIVITFSLLAATEKREILQQGGLISPAFYQFLIISLHIQVLVYVVFGIRQILSFRKYLKNQFSSADKVNFTWISSLFGTILCLWLLDLSRFFASYISEDFRMYLEISLFIGFILFCYFFLFKAMSYRFVSVEDDVQSDNKKLSLSELIRKKYQHQLIQFMDEHKPFLDPEITLTELARKVIIPARSLSEVINISFRQNFYDFINSYRIKESERLFSSDKDPNKTILEVLYAVGFNSKSSFNSAFKRLTGMTPTDYRRNQRLQNQPQKQVG
jgi:AraC-like DNA-binding protein